MVKSIKRGKQSPTQSMSRLNMVVPPVDKHEIKFSLNKINAHEIEWVLENGDRKQSLVFTHTNEGIWVLVKSVHKDDLVIESVEDYVTLKCVAGPLNGYVFDVGEYGICVGHGEDRESVIATGPESVYSGYDQESRFSIYKVHDLKFYLRAVYSDKYFAFQTLAGELYKDEELVAEI